MKIDAIQLNTFLSKATLNGVIPMCVMNVADKKISISVKSVDNVGVVISELKITSNDKMELCIKDTSRLLQALKLFDKEIELIKESNVLSILNADRQVDLTLSSVEFIDNHLTKELKLEYDDGINIKNTLFKNIVKDSSIIGSDKITIEFTETELKMFTGEKGFDTISETQKLDKPYVICKTKFGKMLTEVIEVIDEQINIKMKSDFPVLLTEKTEVMTIKYLVAPIVDKGE